jgi:hypothetical protein
MNRAVVTSAKPKQQNAPECIAARKAEIAQLIEKLQVKVAATPDNGQWGHAGDLGYYIEQLKNALGENG